MDVAEYLTIKTGTLFVFLLMYKVQGKLLEMTYVGIKGTEFGAISATTRANTKIQCANICTADRYCSTFAFDQTTKTCEISDILTPGSKKDVYIKSERKKCLTTQGYRLWILSDMILCIRYGRNTVGDHGAAETKCKKDGGHLVLIENDSMRLHTSDIARKLGASPTEFFYIDGFDKLHNGVFRNWRGERLTWIHWAPGNPDGGDEYCMRGGLGDMFLMRDDECYKSRTSFLCQIEV